MQVQLAKKSRFKKLRGLGSQYAVYCNTLGPNSKNNYNSLIAIITIRALYTCVAVRSMQLTAIPPGSLGSGLSVPTSHWNKKYKNIPWQLKENIIKYHRNNINTIKNTIEYHKDRL